VLVHVTGLHWEYCVAKNAYRSTKVMLSAISATLLAILEAMMAYAPPTPFAYDESPPATEAALFWTGRAFCAGLLALGVALLTGALEGAAFLVAMPFILGAPLV
jgi:hypothetical protein